VWPVFAFGYDTGMKRWGRPVGAAIAAIGLLVGCDSRPDQAAAPSTTTNQSSASTAAPAPPTIAASAPTCAPGGPSPAVAGKDVGAADVDGDKQPDTFTVDDRGEDGAAKPETLRVTTGLGVRSALVLQPAPTVHVLGVRQLDGRPVVFWATGTNESETKNVGLVVFHNCQLRPVQNAQGEPYTFARSGSDATEPRGAGCPEIGGRRTLVGLSGRATGSTVAWTRTAVTINGDQARNGATSSGVYETGKDDDAIALLGEVTCGDKWFDHI
jgi:hypothetical protein